MNIKDSGGNPARHSARDVDTYNAAEEAFQQSSLQLFDKLEAFPRFATKRSIARFLAKSEIFQKIINVNGVIIECGVFNGAGVFTWAQLTNIYEPTNYTRTIIGFDTFEGFPATDAKDDNQTLAPRIGDLKGAQIEEFTRSLTKYNNERHLSHIKNVDLVGGDFMQTGERYLSEHKHLLVSLLYLDFDLYEPTKKALDLFLPRMSKGSIVCFDQLNCPNFPGETQALLESFDLGTCSLTRSPIDPWISYITL